mmetsp:Transcript_14392/g.34609  ORF Transcript_14392/g.34609 Transcript_14392/m.34609 type:complete len:204 (+) Transcript_14392:693-1304(+)
MPPTPRPPPRPPPPPTTPRASPQSAPRAPRSQRSVRSSRRETRHSLLLPLPLLSTSPFLLSVTQTVMVVGTPVSDTSTCTAPPREPLRHHRREPRHRGAVPATQHPGGDSPLVKLAVPQRQHHGLGDFVGSRAQHLEQLNGRRPAVDQGDAHDVHGAHGVDAQIHRVHAHGGAHGARVVRAVRLVVHAQPRGWCAPLGPSPIM